LSRQSKHHDDDGCEGDQEPPESRTGPEVHCRVGAGSDNEYRWLRRPPAAMATSSSMVCLRLPTATFSMGMTRTTRGWVSYWSFNQSCHRTRCHTGSNRQYQLLLRRPRQVCRGPSRLLHQVWHEGISWRRVRGMESFIHSAVPRRRPSSRCPSGAKSRLASRPEQSNLLMPCIKHDAAQLQVPEHSRARAGKRCIR
jgi:hypothetical protein